MIATNNVTTDEDRAFTYTGPGRISIARYPPRDTPAGFRVYRALAPGTWFNSVDRVEYEHLYALQLAQLDPANVWADLHALAGDHEPVLLCWERPPFTETNWCHRRLVASWSGSTLGIRLTSWNDDRSTRDEVGAGRPVTHPRP